MSTSTYRETHRKAKSVMYTFTLWEKVVGALEGLRMRFFPKRILVAGPYVGEFGHELMEWQAWVRSRIPYYDEVHVIVYPGRGFLYHGCQVHFHEVQMEKAGYRHGRFAPRELNVIADAKAAELGLKDYDLLSIQHLCTRHHRRFILPPKFELLSGGMRVAPVHDVAFHFRQVKKEGPDALRNYPPEMCDRLVSLCRELGYRVSCVGHPRYSYCPIGVEDLRSEDLESSVRVITGAKILVGELSGPMHLAQLSGTPILIWAPDQWRVDNCNRWNVFRVPTFVVANDTSSPPPERVVEVIKGAVGRIGSKED